ncbi:hypothetical protein CALCODRAFT_499998 [Calocera cornea HHB12733]|uniref:NAD(P)-binding protein n=1 Tax=Calocera cornea HHB12733 TaxID=1353952 RepID=A0A165E930_9BASI|nr:hypothetical protein CALCODRAFT_499998 [Calocera cornea HHB12733]
MHRPRWRLPGLAIVTALAGRPNALVFAGARSPPSASALHALAAARPGKLHILQLTSADRPGNEAAAEQVKELAGKLDVVVANAGISGDFESSLRVSGAAMREHFEVRSVVHPPSCRDSTAPTDAGSR